MNWRTPLEPAHRVTGSSGDLVIVGGVGDFADNATVRHPDSLGSQVNGALDNLSSALAAEACTLADIVRVKAFCCLDSQSDYWSTLAKLIAGLPDRPAPVVIVHPVLMQPWAKQKVQLQALAVRGWRDGDDIRVVETDIPESVAGGFKHTRVTQGLRAGEFIATGGQSALQTDGSAPTGNGIEQTHVVMKHLVSVLEQLGASVQDAIKKEGYYFGTTMEQWASMAEVRAVYFHEPGPVATVVPCHQLWPEGLLTRVELLALRTTRDGFDKYIPREDSWPRRVWDWPIPVPYRQGLRLRDTIWTGGQVPFEPGTNTGKAVHGGDLAAQTRLTMRYIDDILRGFGATNSDLQWLVCYFESDGTAAATEAFSAVLADTVAGPLPPLTLAPQPSMHAGDMGVEIWGVARG